MDQACALWSTREIYFRSAVLEVSRPGILNSLITEGKQGHTLKPHENTVTKMNLNRIEEVEKSLQKIEEKIKIACNFQRVIITPLVGLI